MPSSTVELDPRAVWAWTIGRMVHLELPDGRVVAFPADRFELLRRATDAQIADVTLRMRGGALRWEQLDEDLTVRGILDGRFQLPLPERVA